MELVDNNVNEKGVGNALEMGWEFWGQQTKKKKLELTRSYNIHIVNPGSLKYPDSQSVVEVLSERYRIRDIVLRNTYGMWTLFGRLVLRDVVTYFVDHTLRTQKWPESLKTAESLLRPCHLSSLDRDSFVNFINLPVNHWKGLHAVFQ